MTVRFDASSGPEDLWIEVPGRGPDGQGREEQGGQADADRRVPPEQGNRDPGEADRGGEDVVRVQAELPAEDVERPGETGEGAGDRHREHVVPRDRDPAVARGLRVEPDRPHLVAERRPVQRDPVDDERREGDEEADVEALEQRIAPEDVQLRLVEDVVGDGHGLAARVVVLERAAEPEEEDARPRGRCS